uniref:Tubulin-specific chaperone D n=1 Tax=Dunaliella tertiolecta TaxID=3047 RepID=A0A7S3QWP0_DUNTE
MDAQEQIRAVEEDRDETAEFLEEAGEVVGLIARVVNSDGSEAEAVYERYKAILCKYQEQSQLLDVWLESIVGPLAGLLRKQAVDLHADASRGGDTAQQAQHSMHSTPMRRVFALARLLNVLVTVRGYKTVVKFFPHEAADLETVVNVIVLLQRQPVQDMEQGIGSWEAQTMLLLWLSMLALIPFEFSTVETVSEEGRPRPYPALVSKLMDICKDYLRHPGGMREMAALILGRLLTRPDMATPLADFVSWSKEALSCTDSVQAPFLVPGVLQALSFVFKLGQRHRLLPHAARVWELLLPICGASGAGKGGAAGEATAQGVLVRKLGVKLAQRVGLTFLEPRVAPWRYVRVDAGADIQERLGGEASTHVGTAPAQAGATGANQEESAEDFEVAEELEEVIEVLLNALRDKDTVVRWSGAKGVGRITSCLPRELADDVVASVVELFGRSENDTAWHGGCLALAELSRRGLLLPHCLDSLVPIIQEALLYDIRRGPHSIGAHVRDAAAYVCWAFARAYEPHLLAGHVDQFASTLLTVACYDREINCRRAAAAAFQESVGRLGNFPHGIDLLTVADYFSVGNIAQAYTRVAPQVAAFAEYRLPLAQHLVRAKLRHWEKSMRELAARGLAALVPAVGESYIIPVALRQLIEWGLDNVLEVRHGAIVGVAELLPALKDAGMTLPDDLQAKVADLIPAIDKARLYRGKGGEVMREAVCKLVCACARVQLPLTAAQHTKFMEAVDENLRHPNGNIQKLAVAAVGEYASAYVVSEEEVARFRRHMDAYLTRLHDPNVAVRRGYASALGALPGRLLQGRAEEVIDALVDGTTLQEDVDDRDVEARVKCVRALGSACSTLFSPASAYTQPAAEQPSGLDIMLKKVLPCVHTNLEDYTTDNRGDVGSWVREAAMDVLEALTLLVGERVQRDCPSNEQQGEILAGVVPAATGALLKQAVERIARIRDLAARRLHSLVSCPHVARAMPAAGQLAAALPKDDGTAEVVSLQSIKRLSGLLLAAPQYARPVLEGLVASIGGVDAQLAKVASEALLSLTLSHTSVAQHTSSNYPSNPTPNHATTNPANTTSNTSTTNTTAMGSTTTATTPLPSGRGRDAVPGCTAGSSMAAAGRHAPPAVIVGAKLLAIWRDNSTNIRLLPSLVRTADLLISRAFEAMDVLVEAPTPHKQSDPQQPAVSSTAPPEAAPQQQQQQQQQQQESSSQQPTSNGNIQSQPPVHGVYVRNLPQGDELTEALLEEHFGQFGALKASTEVPAVTIVVSPKYGKVAYIKFEQGSSVQAARQSPPTIGTQRCEVLPMVPEYVNGPQPGMRGIGASRGGFRSGGAPRRGGNRFGDGGRPPRSGAGPEGRADRQGSPSSGPGTSNKDQGSSQPSERPPRPAGGLDRSAPGAERSSGSGGGGRGGGRRSRSGSASRPKRDQGGNGGGQPAPTPTYVPVAPKS